MVQRQKFHVHQRTTINGNVKVYSKREKKKKVEKNEVIGATRYFRVYMGCRFSHKLLIQVRCLLVWAKDASY